MCCNSCQSDNVRTFTGESAIHLPGLKSLNMPIVWVFPKLRVCLDCGFAEFQIPEKELKVLEEGAFAKEGRINLALPAKNRFESG
jgi:hypothetical protein